MKKYISFLILILFEILLFYIFPLFCGPTDIMGMVIIMLFITFILSFFSGFIKSNLKYLFPFLVSFIFLPSIFIYYNESAFIHIIWYFIVSLIGEILGILSFSLINKIKK